VFARRLQSTGSTLWDNATGSVVTHEVWNWPRAVVCWIVGAIAIAGHIFVLLYFWAAQGI